MNIAEPGGLKSLKDTVDSIVQIDFVRGGYICEKHHIYKAHSTLYQPCPSLLDLNLPVQYPVRPCIYVAGLPGSVALLLNLSIGGLPSVVTRMLWNRVTMSLTFCRAFSRDIFGVALPLGWDSSGPSY